MLGLSTTVLVSLGRERTALAITAVALALLAATCVVIIPLAPFGDAQLVATATRDHDGARPGARRGRRQRAQDRRRVRPVEDGAPRRRCASRARSRSAA